MLLKVFQFVEGLVELAGEMRLVAGNLLQGLIVGQDALPAHNVYGGEKWEQYTCTSS